MSSYKKHSFFIFVITSCLSFGFGCHRPHVPKPEQAPTIKHCFDSVGHIPGSKPFLLGGTCCCTPSPRVMPDWQAHGYFVGKTAGQVIEMYHAKGIKLVIDHQNCNNACEDGPHIVKGGKCMVPPTPGTENYEEVLFGCAYVDKKEAPKSYKKQSPSTDVAYTIAPKAKKK